MSDNGEEDGMAVRIAQQQAMLEQQQQDDLLRRQRSALQELSNSSMSDHEAEMQRQMLSVMPAPPGFGGAPFSSSGTNSDMPLMMGNVPPPGVMQSSRPPGVPPTPNFSSSGSNQDNSNIGSGPMQGMMMGPPGTMGMGQNSGPPASNSGPMGGPGQMGSNSGSMGPGPMGSGPPGQMGSNQNQMGHGPPGMGPPGMGPPGMGPPGMVPPGMGPPGMGPPGMGPPGMGPPGMGPPGMGPPGMGPPGMGPPGMGPPGMGPPGMGPPGMGPPGMGPPGMGPPGMGPPGMGPPNMGPPGMGPPGMGPPGMGPPGMGPPGMGPPPLMGRGPGGMMNLPPGMGPPPTWGGSMGDRGGSMGDRGGSMGDRGGSMGDSGSREEMPQRPQNSSNLPSLLSLKVEKPEELKNKKPSEVVLPKALEEALAFKDQRAAAVGSNEDQEPEPRAPTPPPAPVISSEYEGEGEDEEGDSDDDDDGVMAPPPPTISKQEGLGKANKNKRKKKRKKVAKANRLENKKEEQMRKQEDDKDKEKSQKNNENAPDVEVEYIQENLQFHELEPMYRQFHRIFEVFKISEVKPELEELAAPSRPVPAARKAERVQDQFEVDEETEEKKANDEKERLSKRKLKKLSRLSVAELKQLVVRPDVVEMYDVTARDPRLLVQLKAHRNTVQVPRHWCYKRKYLQGKRGIEKPPFDLPDFIKKTGIMEMRASLQDKEEAKTLKAKMRERARPKLGKIDIDYQKLHDAFFKWQTKPRMTIHGDLYYEGKEFETRLKEKKPGDLSEELRTALGMPVGPNSHKVPPPWLIAQQRYGPPPSYPNLKIAGLNAPIPEGCAFGYHAGGWGKPPVDEHGKPLYGDVFGHTQNLQDDAEEPEVDRTMWGELESESEGESSEEESEGEDGGPENTEALASGLVTPGEGLATPSGMTSVPQGLETPETIELRKKKIENDIEGGETPVLYQVLAEKRGVTAGMMASTHVYDMTGAGGAQPPTVIAARRGQAGGGVTERGGAVELALDPSELELDAEAMAARYEQQLRAQQHHPAKEDLSDMLAEHVARQKSKRKRQQTTDSKQAKKYKEFKF